ncbi:MAG: CorA family divalent cation transporter, partial [Dehalococcoidales bacterium]|nr:CorA family divalent cation transporter [Dehalococcoidales bacterium]
SFSKAIETAAGVTFDLDSLIQLNTDFVEASEKYLLLNIKEYGVEKPDNMLFLIEDKAFVFSGSCPSPSAFKAFESILSKPSGISTIQCFLVLDKVVDNHKKQLEGFLDKIKTQEETFDQVENRKLNLEIERFSDRLEEFHDLLLELQERRYKQVQFHYISFDYRVLLAESLSLQGRARRRIESLKRLRQDHAIRASEELNQRILKLNDVVTRLTAITVIFMVPTLIASHFGMNFQFMPELHLWWTYPAVLAGQIVIIIAGILIFRKVGWL